MKLQPATPDTQSVNIEGRIVFLDYLRIFAFTTVLIGHTYYGYAEAYIQDQSHLYILRSVLSLLLPIFYGGGTGVVVFFLVSGYIIAHVLQTEQTSEFIIKRIFRIYPLYMFAVLTQSMAFLASKAGSNFIVLYFQYVSQHPEYLMGQLPNMFSQFFLLGDFFGTPWTLGGVEWSLRLEIIFYVYMAILRWLNIFQLHKKFLPYILSATSILLILSPPFPHWNYYTNGSLNIYAPFFLLGAIFYLTATKAASRYYLLVSIVLVMYQYFTAMTAYQPMWIGTQFAMLALLIFSTAWMFRKYFIKTSLIVFLSELTYATYLFHAWLYNYLERLVINYSLLTNYVDIQALLLLLTICILTVRWIEKPGVKFGNRLIKKYL